MSHQHIIGHFGDQSFQSITFTGTDNVTRTTKRQNTQITQNNPTQKGVLVNSTTDTLKKSRIRDRTDRAWFSRLSRHPAMKRSGSILSTPEPARPTALKIFQLNYNHSYTKLNPR